MKSMNTTMRTLAAAILIASGAAAAVGDTYTWTGGARNSNGWNHSRNWEKVRGTGADKFPGGPDGTLDSVVIPDGAGEITVDRALVLKTLAIANGGGTKLTARANFGAVLIQATNISIGRGIVVAGADGVRRHEEGGDVKLHAEQRLTIARGAQILGGKGLANKGKGGSVELKAGRKLELEANSKVTGGKGGGGADAHAGGDVRILSGRAPEPTDVFVRRGVQVRGGDGPDGSQGGSVLILKDGNDIDFDLSGTLTGGASEGNHNLRIAKGGGVVMIGQPDAKIRWFRTHADAALRGGDAEFGGKGGSVSVHTSHDFPETGTNLASMRAGDGGRLSRRGLVGDGGNITIQAPAFVHSRQGVSIRAGDGGRGNATTQSGKGGDVTIIAADNRPVFITRPIVAGNGGAAVGGGKPGNGGDAKVRHEGHEDGAQAKDKIRQLKAGKKGAGGEPDDAKDGRLIVQGDGDLRFSPDSEFKGASAVHIECGAGGTVDMRGMGRESVVAQDSIVVYAGQCGTIDVRDVDRGPVFVAGDDEGSICLIGQVQADIPVGDLASPVANDGGCAAFCPADFNGDGLHNTVDVLDYLNAFTSRLPEAEMNCDGRIDTSDFVRYLNFYTNGCG